MSRPSGFAVIRYADLTFHVTPWAKPYIRDEMTLIALHDNLAGTGYSGATFMADGPRGPFRAQVGETRGAVGVGATPVHALRAALAKVPA